LHIAAMACGPETRFAIIRRREGNQFKYFVNQLKWFTGREPLVLNALTGLCLSYRKKRHSSKTYTMVDFDAIRQTLQTEGFVDGNEPWTSPSVPEIRAEIEYLQSRLGTRLMDLSATG
jgi:hypothetical protein